MIAFLCLLAGFFTGFYCGAVAYRSGCKKQIASERMITIGAKTYRLTEVEAQSEK